MKHINFILFLLLSFSLSAQKINISIFNDNNLNSVILTINQGSYNLVKKDSQIIRLKENSIINIAINKDKITFRLNSGKTEYVDALLLKHNSAHSSLKIKPVFPSAELRRYQGDFKFSLLKNKLLIINTVDIDDYISGVVESESGQKTTSEYYKTQAIICRTYALAHVDRHADEGFQLCDGIHCQVYLGMSFFRPEIIAATKATSGLVIVDTESNLITAAFHSNCGGETVNSEKIWSLSKPYLVSVKDSFCIRSPHSVWEKSIPVKKWIKYLTDNGIRDAGSLNPESLTFEQVRRKTYYTVAKDSIPLKKIRNDWDLRSTFFSISLNDSILVLHGKGFGHGIGLCQEGAMAMAASGRSYTDIIKYYYHQVRIVPLQSLAVKK